jgi:hypothetical protein
MPTVGGVKRLAAAVAARGPVRRHPEAAATCPADDAWQDAERRIAAWLGGEAFDLIDH